MSMGVPAGKRRMVMFVMDDAGEGTLDIDSTVSAWGCGPIDVEYKLRITGPAAGVLSYELGLLIAKARRVSSALDSEEEEE